MTIEGKKELETLIEGDISEFSNRQLRRIIKLIQEVDIILEGRDDETPLIARL